MREIEFRGLNTSGEWVYGSYVSYYEGHHEIHCKIDQEGDFNNYKVNGGTVGQCTGLKDCNGVKIFEGDIVIIIDDEKDQFEELKYVVEWSEYAKWIVSHSATEFYDAVDFNLMVIGNIHEKA